MSSDLAARLLLYSLPMCGPARGSWLSQHPLGLAGAVEALRRGDVSPIGGPSPKGVTPDLIDRWSTRARMIDEQALLAKHQRGGQLLGPGDAVWPFADDPEPPLFLHAWGDTKLLDVGPTVGVVGTRRCTTVGRRVAKQLGADLADAGVSVISGLAKGVDEAAHGGALDAKGPVVGVVASGLDVVYPRSSEALWHSVATRGLLLSEAPLGTTPERWRFPARNRIIAALSDFVVVVESHSKGGALSTADEAALRGIAVGAVPGSVVSPAAAGTNGLLCDGCIPIRSAQDVLDVLGFAASQSAATVPLEIGLGQTDQIIVRELQAQAAHFDVLAEATCLPIKQLMPVLSRLAADGVITIDGTTAMLTTVAVDPPPPKACLS